MVDVTKAMQWWQEEQLRILVLGSVAIQLFLLTSTSLRKFTISPKTRRLIWLAYLGSDALAIYALATLFNHHKEQGKGSNSLLVLLWAPILLMHLGGHGDITAYNIEDNELWLRLVVSAWSHITVAGYVLWKSWPAGGDKLLLWAAILLFLQGANECVGKSHRLRFGSVEGLVLLLDRKTRTRPSIIGEETHEASLDNFVGEVRYYISTSMANKGDHTPAAADANATNPQPANPAADADNAIRLHPFRQTLDLLCPYTDRLHLLKSFWELSDKKMQDKLKRGLSDTFDAIYTGRKIPLLVSNLKDRTTTDLKDSRIKRPMISFLMRYIPNLQLAEAMIHVMFPLTALVLFHKSHKEHYSHGDIKVTYALFVCTSVCHLLASINHFWYLSLSIWPAEVAQYGLAAFFLKKHSRCQERLRWLLKKAVSLVVEDWRHVESILKALYSMDRRGASSSRGIIKLVRAHLKHGWEEHIHDAAGYRRFNDQRGQLTLTRHQCHDLILRRSLMVPLDESVLLWHMATDMCFFYSQSPGHQCAMRDAPGCAAWCSGHRHHQKATLCREMSNYMVHLLCENPEMLMAGARRTLFPDAYKELVKLFKDDDNPPMEERGVTQAMIAMVQVQLEVPAEGPQRSLIRDAFKLAQALQRLRDGNDDKKMWKVIQGVWVEMLCFSAGRCRGFLHAKSLATGGELLNYIWLLMSYMGMETLVERMQRPELSASDGGNNSAAPQPSELHKGGGGSDSGSGAPSTCDIHIEVKV